MIDPRKAVDLVGALPDHPTMNVRGSWYDKNRILIKATTLLALHGNARWREVYRNILLLRTPDQDVPSG